MAHSLDRGGVSRGGGAVRCLLFFVVFMLVCYFVRPPSIREESNAAMLASCPPCVCDCSRESILTMPFDCGNNDLEMSEEMGKDIVALLSEEITLQKNVTSDSSEHTQALIMSTNRVSAQYQNEAAKCNARVEACEEARERAEAMLREELKLSAVWEARTRENGWNE
ncbi:hypothetical protein LIER_32331 [Lithospermum erythrorhizon]|uniref:Uncharacterized protein n=1 Tax=Lithospermum erythrorhizon TaxID=34254 RepID=A0AAV3RTK8_LITER